MASRGTSRTFMGEEAAGIDAARIALARIASGQSDIALVGAAHNGERTDLLILYEFGDFNLKGKFAPVWARGQAQRLCARLGRRFPGDRIQGARGGARRQALREADQRGRRPRAAQAARRGDEIAGSAVVEARRRRRQGAIITGATGAEPVTSEEKAFLSQHAGLRGARDRDHVRPHDGNAVSAGPCAGGAFDLARRAVSAQRSHRAGD